MTRLMLARFAAAVIVLGTQAVPASAQESLDAARELYAAAAYEEALNVLERLKTANPTQETRAVAQYRAFCLLALGRRDEAELAIEEVVAAAPAYEPDEAEVSPRVRSAFAEVRRRMLPAIVQQQYAEAKARFDARAYEEAARLFRVTIDLLDDPASGLPDEPSLADLRTLASGFMDLSLAAAAPPAPPPAPEPEAPPASPAPTARPRIYAATDPSVVPPVTIRQDLPQLTRVPGFNFGGRGVLEVVIDEAGEVESAVLRQSVNRLLDKQLIEATRAWKYRPATVDGSPVRFRKAIQISVERD